MNRNLIKIISALIVVAVLISCARIKRWQDTHTPPDDACVHCHSAIYKNWKISYRPYNESARMEDYSPVHSRPMSSEDVKMRKSHIQGKGECSDCHVVQRSQELLSISMLGASFEDKIFQVCGRCHQETFRQWKETTYFDDQVACLECHAKSREERIEGGDAFPHRTEDMKGFDPSAMKLAVSDERLKKAVSVEKSVLEKKQHLEITLAIANDGSGHNLPAEAADTALIVRLDLTGPGGVLTDSKESPVAGRDLNSIPFGKTVYFNYDRKALARGEYHVEISIIRSKTVLKKETAALMYSGKFKVVIP